MLGLWWHRQDATTLLPVVAVKATGRVGHCLVYCWIRH